jgi:glycosyltransferase involved in cell wall biosynthesis
MKKPYLKPVITLFLNENPLPAKYTAATIPGKELRLRSAITAIDEVHVISFRGKPLINLTSSHKTTLEKKIHVHLLPAWPHYLKTIPLTMYGLWFAIKHRPIIIEAESPLFSGLAAVTISKITSIPCLIEIRNTFLSMLSHRLQVLPYGLKEWLVNSVQTFTCSQASGLIANSRHYHQLFKPLNQQITVINPGLQGQVAYQKTTSNVFRLAYIGRLVKDKGVHLLIDLALELKSLPQIPPWQLTIAGDGPLKHSLLSKIKIHNLSDHVFSPVPNQPIKS